MPRRPIRVNVRKGADDREMRQREDSRGNHYHRRMVGCGLWRSINDGRASSWICHSVDVLHSSVSVPYYPVDVEVYPKVGIRQLMNGVYAFSEMAGRISMIRGFYAHFMGRTPGMVGLEDCENLLARRKNKQLTTVKFQARHLLAIKQALGSQELDNIYWLAGYGNPAAGLTKTKSDMTPLLRLLASGANDPGALRLLKGVASCGIASCGLPACGM